MGALVYGPADHRVVIDDRTLSHLQLIIVAKLRRTETFVFTCEGVVTAEGGVARLSIWLHPSMFLAFEFDEVKPPSINREWLELLSLTANGSGGLRIVPEPTGASPQG